MLKEFERNLTFSDYLIECAHQRTGVYMTTTNSQVLEEKARLGWNYRATEKGFWLRAPDISLVDITDPFRIYQLGNDVNNFACFNYLTALKSEGKLPEMMDWIISKNSEKYKGFDYFISEGPVLEAEIRIGGSDMRVNELKRDVLDWVLEDKNFGKHVSEASEYLGERRPTSIIDKKLGHFGPKSAEFINLLNRLNQAICSPSEPVRMRTIDDLNGQLPGFDVMIFVPKGCYKYITSFLRDDIIDKIMLWEIHIEQNPPETFKLFTKDLLNKRCLIVDRSYSGKTLNLISEFVRQEGGIPVRLAVFPKSKLSMEGFEYSLFLDRIINCKDPILDGADWARECYKKILTTSV